VFKEFINSTIYAFVFNKLNHYYKKFLPPLIECGTKLTLRSLQSVHSKRHSRVAAEENKNGIHMNIFYGTKPVP